MSKPIKTCAHCGKQFSTYQKAQLYCSRFCAAEGRAEKLAGKKFGRLECLSVTKTKTGNRAWLCVCECGNKTTVSVARLLSGQTVSCGCYHSDMMRAHMEIVGSRNKKHCC